MGVSLNSGTAIGNQNMGDPVFLVDALGRPIGNGGALVIAGANGTSAASATNPAPVTTVNNVQTFVINALALVPTTDGIALSIPGAAGSIIRVANMSVGGLKTVAEMGFVTLRRFTGPTGGTSSAAPVAPMRTGNAAFPSSPLRYTVAPTVTSVGDTGGGYPLLLGVETTECPRVVVTYGDDSQRPAIEGAADYLGVFLGAFSAYTGALLYISVTVTVEAA